MVCPADVEIRADPSKDAIHPPVRRCVRVGTTPAPSGSQLRARGFARNWSTRSPLRRVSPSLEKALAPSGARHVGGCSSMLRYRPASPPCQMSRWAGASTLNAGFLSGLPTPAVLGPKTSHLSFSRAARIAIMRFTSSQGPSRRFALRGTTLDCVAPEWPACPKIRATAMPARTADLTLMIDRFGRQIADGGQSEFAVCRSVTTERRYARRFTDCVPEPGFTPAHYMP